MERLNAQMHPELKRLSLGKVSLEFSKHCYQRAAEKSIRLIGEIFVPAGSVVEIERQNGLTNKLVVRLQYNMNYDIVLVLVPSRPGLFNVITVWLNHVNDNHGTLNRERIGKVA